MEFSSSEIVIPKIVTSNADNFVIGGIVMVIMDVGGMLVVRMKPAKMLPKANRMIGLVRLGLFSLIEDVEVKRGSFSKAK